MKWTSQQHDRFAKLNATLQVELRGQYPEELITKYCVWIIDNEIAFKKFRDFALEIHKKGHRKYSSNCILNYLRWHEVFTTHGDPFKINNDFSPIMARHLVYHYPKLHDLFMFRKTKSQK